MMTSQVRVKHHGRLVKGIVGNHLEKKSAWGWACPMIRLADGRTPSLPSLHRRIGGLYLCFGAESFALNYHGAGPPLRCLIQQRAGKGPKRYEMPTQANQELQAKQIKTKQNKTKQNKTKQNY